MKEEIIEAAKKIRDELKPIEASVLALKTNQHLVELAPSDPTKTEAFANIMLAYRHVEDARMRLGKMIQAVDGGTSVYPR